MEGIFAVEKPTGITSAKYVVKVQNLLAKDKSFIDRKELKYRKRKRLPPVKIGHGGTLDPCADGILILGINGGTKRLTEFLESAKTYQVIALLGSSTTTYDSEGAIMERASWEDITTEKIDSILSNFRGEIYQIPPIYSAIKIGGTALYDYARNSEALPRAISPRKVTIYDLNLLGTLTTDHAYVAPTRDATDQEKDQEAVFRAAGLNELVKLGNQYAQLELDQLGQSLDNVTERAKQLISKREEQDKEKEDSGKIQDDDNKAGDDKIVEPVAPELSTSTRPPVFEFTATVSSGTYIRSLVHDLANALGTKAHVVKLTRVKQGDWELGKNVIPHQEISNRPFEEWAPKIKHYLANGPLAEYESDDQSSKIEDS
ncbi:pseudouridine synthase [Lipomyces japonicus]|uniref:pseudouridine synthase n=1 Tax=Lipomyces japonicus TaxID=56871 RepID=UPI0034CFC2A1